VGPFGAWGPSARGALRRVGPFYYYGPRAHSIVRNPHAALAYLRGPAKLNLGPALLKLAHRKSFDF